MLGVFTPDVVTSAVFDPTVQAVGWWDPDLLDNAVASSADFVLPGPPRLMPY